MPPVSNYLNGIQANINAAFPGGWAAFPVNTPVVVGAVTAPVCKTVGGHPEIHVPAGWLNGPADEVRDTLLFEGINAFHKPLLDNEQAVFNTDNRDLATYGRAYSDIEATTGWLTGLVLQDMHGNGVALSNWGGAFLNNFLQFANLGLYQQNFATTPQDPAANDQRALPSAQCYAAEWATRTSAQTITRKVRDHWITVQFNQLNPRGRDAVTNLMNGYTDAMVRFNAGSRGRMTKYNEMLVALAGSNLFGAPPAFINAPAYLCPVF